jgi:predicted Zn-dependent protease
MGKITTPTISRRAFLLTLAGGAGALLVGCSREDVHKAAAKLIPQETLREMGLQTWERFRGQFSPSRNVALKRRLQAIGTRVVRAAKGNPEEWEFAVFRGGEINAFAVPGGKVGFFEGMFTAAKNDAQIGAVLGHEIGHLKAKHPEERIMAGLAKQVGITVVLAALQAGDVSYANEIAGLLGVGLEYGIIRPYSRRQELEADRLGVEYLTRAGYPAGEALSFWTNMMALSRSRPQPPAILSTHPSDEKRIMALREVLDEAQRKT